MAQTSSRPADGRRQGIPQRMYVGGYTASSGGHGPGITVFDRESPTAGWHATQVVEADDPTFLAVREGALHAVSETTEGRLLSFSIGAGVLEAASSAASGGAAPCHVLWDPASGSLVVANYLAGTIGVLSADALDPARVTRALALPVGRGPVSDRQDHPHAHNVIATAWGTLLVSDLGTDRLFEVAIDPVTRDPSFVASYALPSGSGPRHLAWLDDQLLVAGELDGRLHVMSRSDNGVLTVDYSVDAYDSAQTFAGTDVLLSHLTVARLGPGGAPVVYVAVRGRDTITAFTQGPDGRLVVAAEVSSGGRWPRHFAFDGASLYVANQLSDNVAVLPVDPETGIPGQATVQIALGSPSCVVFG